MKLKLELNIIDDELTFLNFWDLMHGHDVIASLIGDKLLMDGKEISLPDFIREVKKVLKI